MLPEFHLFSLDGKTKEADVISELSLLLLVYQTNEMRGFCKAVLTVWVRF